MMAMGYGFKDILETSEVQGQPGLQRKTLSENKKKKKGKGGGKEEEPGEENGK